MVESRLFVRRRFTYFGQIHGKKFGSFCIFFALALIFSLFGVSLGEKIEYCYDAKLNDSPGWSQNIAAQMFDPSLGKLNKAQIIMNQTIFRDINASNNMDIPANVTFNGYGNLSLILPDKSILNAESVIN